MAERTHGPAQFRTFVVLWATQSLSLIGSGITLVTTTLWATRVIAERSTLALALASLSLASLVPTLVTMPLAGAFADRHDRRRTMLWMNVGCAAASAGLAGLLGSDVVRLWMVCGLVATVAALNAFHSAAFEASYVMVVERSLLPRANGMMQTTWALRGLVAPAVAALLFGLPALAREQRWPGWIGAWLARFPDGAALSVALDAVSFAIAALALAGLAIPSPRRTSATADRSRPSVWDDCKEGVAFLRSRRALLWLLSLFIVSNFAIGPLQVLQPLFVKLNLADDLAARGRSFAAGFAMLASLSSVGGILGGILVSVWGGLEQRRIRGVLVPMIVIGLAEVGLGASTTLPVATALAFALVFMGPVLNAHSQAIWQRETPPELQGRTSAVRRTCALATVPISTAIAGWLTGAINPGAVMSILGAILALATAAQLFSRHRLGIERDATAFEGVET